MPASWEKLTKIPLVSEVKPEFATTAEIIRESARIVSASEALEKEASGGYYG